VQQHAATKGIADRLPLAGRHAVVTGGGRGIGLAIAETLARLGADVTIMGRNLAALQERAADLGRRFEAEVMCERLDVTDPELIESAFRAASGRRGPPAILVNNAGIARAEPFAKTGLGIWREVLDTDLTGAFLCIAQVLKAMAASDFGRIVNIASTAGLSGYPYIAAYCAAKHGLIGLTRALAREYARSPVTINAVCPGYADTDIVTRAVAGIAAKTGRSPGAALAELVSHNPQGRLVQPREVAETVAWLCLPSSASVSGQSIVVAGGELM
jgi:NAD(P)-dependent dehydrogenase (short-subunit alcohol dehydrogenase family)